MLNDDLLDLVERNGTHPMKAHIGVDADRLWFVVDELDALGHIEGLKDALARVRKFGGRCVLGFQSIAQVSTIYGQGPAKTIVENCSNSLVLRCSASEGGGTAQFASALIGKREIVRQTVTQNTEAHLVIDDTLRGYSYKSSMSSRMRSWLRRSRG